MPLIGTPTLSPLTTHSPHLASALLHRHWPSMQTLALHHTDPYALLRMRARHEGAPRGQRAEEEARLTDLYGQEELRIVLWKRRRGCTPEPLASTQLAIDDGYVYTRFLDSAHALRCLSPFPLSLMEWADTYLVVDCAGRKLWEARMDFENLEIEPSQPFFNATPGEERWQGSTYGFVNLTLQPPSIAEDDFNHEDNDDLFPILTLDFAFAAPAAGARQLPLCDVEMDDMCHDEPLRIDALTLEFRDSEFNQGLSFPSRFSFLKALEFSFQCRAWEAESETARLARLVDRFKGSVLVLEVLDAGGRVVAFQHSDVVIEKGAGVATEVVAPGGDRDDGREEGDEKWVEEWEEAEAAGSNDNASNEAFSMPPLFLRRGARLQWAQQGQEEGALTAVELHDSRFRLVLLDARETRAVTLASGGDGEGICGRILAPFPRCIWLRPFFCSMPRRLGGGMAVRLALGPNSLDEATQELGEARAAPFASAATMLLALEMCLFGVLQDEWLDDGEEEEEEEGEEDNGRGMIVTRASKEPQCMSLSVAVEWIR